MSKLLKDILMKKDLDHKGRMIYDKQSVIFVITFILSILLGITNTLISYISGIVINPIASEVFTSFMFLTAALSGTNIASKYVEIVKAKTLNNMNDNCNNDPGLNSQEPNNPYPNDTAGDTRNSTRS